MAPDPAEQAKSRSGSRSQQGSRAGERSHTRGKPSKSSQKAMLSKALQKANTAVQLDNAQNFEGARLCYLDACDLLQQVLQKTASEDDQRKLEAIRKTYTSRIEELDQLAYEEFTDDKELPPPPASSSPSLQPVEDVADDEPVVETATSGRLVYSGESQTSREIPIEFDPGWSAPVPNESGGDRGFQPPSAGGSGDPDRDSNMASGSWLDAKADSGGSASSSVHSRSSSAGVRRKYMMRPPSGDTEAEFDAALDAAVEAAYDDGYEPAESEDDHASAVANALMRVELAKERVRQSEREVAEFNQGKDVQQNTYLYDQQPPIREQFYEESSDEEERLLEEMTRGYEIEEFAFSERVGAGQGPGARKIRSRSSMKPSPVTSPPPQQPATGSDSETEGVGGLNSEKRPTESVRSRRMSGQNQLKIETSKLGQMRHHDPIREVDGDEYEAGLQGGDASPDRVPESLKLLSGGSPTDLDEQRFPDEFSPVEGPDDGLETSDSPLARSLLTKNYSSSSLRSARSRNFSLSHLDDISDLSPGTPSSNPFASTSRLPVFPGTSSTPMGTTFDDQLSADPAESLYLFDGQYQNASNPGSPGTNWEDAPVDLEPCPNDFMLRPFWLMRCLYQTIAHPRGGYLSSRLFVPQDVWRVKGVKLRNLEDKVAACDYLTATLLKLGQVDTFDADAVLEEMQSLEGVLDQMSTNLTRKLGADVGVQDSGVLFKGYSNGADTEPPPSATVPRSASVSGKSANAFSWRRLRAKNSAAGLSASYNANGNGKVGGENGIDSPGLDSLPMTLQPTSRPPKRVVDQARFSGPHAGYMESLARLFDAAQTVDQIARQVEDPGLRHADKTQVGLELCTRHAAEFFAFYICRFALTDLNTLLEKFVKRGTEWVTS